MQKDRETRRALGSKQTDEALFKIIEALPDYPFKLIASKIRLPTGFEEEKGIYWSISSPDKVEIVKNSTQKLHDFGLINLSNNSSDRLLMEIDQSFTIRLSKRHDLIKRLKANAKSRNMSLRI